MSDHQLGNKTIETIESLQDENITLTLVKKELSKIEEKWSTISDYIDRRSLREFYETFYLHPLYTELIEYTTGFTQAILSGSETKELERKMEAIQWILSQTKIEYLNPLSGEQYVEESIQGIYFRIRPGEYIWDCGILDTTRPPKYGINIKPWILKVWTNSWLIIQKHNSCTIVSEGFNYCYCIIWSAEYEYWEKKYVMLNIDPSYIKDIKYMRIFPSKNLDWYTLKKVKINLIHNASTDKNLINKVQKWILEWQNKEWSDVTIETIPYNNPNNDDGKIVLNLRWDSSKWNYSLIFNGTSTEKEI